MIRIAIVGEIGSGKTITAKSFRLPTFHADTQVAEIYKKDRKCYNKLKKNFPELSSLFQLKKKK